MTKILVTGAAGFIGYHVCVHLLEQEHEVVGIDNLNDYYSVDLKEARLVQLVEGDLPFKFRKMTLGKDSSTYALRSILEEEEIEVIIHLAAQAGVRHSLQFPQQYIDSNISGFLDILEGCRHSHGRIKHLIYASSSSVYGLNRQYPFQEDQSVGHPANLYGATKRMNELMAHSYSHLFHIPTTGLRFFTVYGPWGRPDMMMWKFADQIMSGGVLQLYNNGEHERDFTYVDDVVEAISRLLRTSAEPGCEQQDNHNMSPCVSDAPFRVYNIGGENPVSVPYVVSLLEQQLDKKAVTMNMPMHIGDVRKTAADVTKLRELVDFSPQVSIEEGVGNFCEWYRWWREKHGS